MAFAVFFFCFPSTFLSSSFSFACSAFFSFIIIICSVGRGWTRGAAGGCRRRMAAAAGRARAPWRRTTRCQPPRVGVHVRGGRCHARRALECGHHELSSMREEKRRREDDGFVCLLISLLSNNIGFSIVFVLISIMTCLVSTAEADDCVVCFIIIITFFSFQ